jgi:hypothetical protein
MICPTEHPRWIDLTSGERFNILLALPDHWTGIPDVIEKLIGAFIADRPHPAINASHLADPRRARSLPP